MNVNQLQLPPQPQLQRFSKDAPQKDADFLSLKLLNRRSRLRLSPEPIPLDDLPPTARLFAVANSKPWFAAAVRTQDTSYALSLSPLADLRAAFTSTSSDPPLALNPSTTISLQARTPHIVAITRDDSRILVAFTDGSIGVFDWSTPAPLFTFPSSGPKSIRDIFPSTGDSHIVAVLREPGNHASVQLLDAHNMVSVGAWNGGGSPATNASSVSWSPKGKQIAIGLENGDVVTFSPSDTSALKSVVPHPPSVDGQSVISLQWLSNTEFHGIYAAASPLAPDSEQTHFILSLEAKANLAGDIKLTTPYLPFPGLRPPGSFIVTLRNWGPYRFLLFVGDSTSSDVGLIGSLTNATSPADSWYNLALEEDSTPSVPLDTDLNETVLLGLELDVTSTETFRYTGVSGEATDVPAPPIMYLYASDGTLTGWHIIQTQGVPYPDMSASATPVPSSSTAATLSAAQSSAFGAPQSAFETSPTVTAPSAFGSVSPQNATAAPSSGSAFGFSAFSGAPSAFGSTSFGFSQQSLPQEPKGPSPPQAPPLSAPTMSVEMTSATDESMASETESGLGGLSLGGGSGESKSGTTNSMFGSFGNTAQQATPSAFSGEGPTASPTFATFGSGPVKPAVGFGAFAANGPSAFGSSSGFGGSAFSSGGGAFSSGASNAGSGVFSTTQSTSAENKPAAGFGQSGFGTASAKPAFGQSGFGQTSFGQSSAFGKPAFGSSLFGASTASSQPAATSTFSSGASAGGFAAFASQGTSSFGATAQNSTDLKPVWAQDASQEKPQESTIGTPSALGGSPGASPFSSSKTSSTTTSIPAGGAFAGLGQTTQSASGGSVFGKTTFGQPSFGQPAFGQSPFGQPSSPSVASAKSTTTGPFGGGGGFGSFANAGPSAFGTAASPAKDAKPAWATAPSDSTSEEQSNSAFGLGAAITTPSAFGSTSSVSPTAAETTSPTSPEKPVPPVSTPPATPPVKSQAKPETPTPASTTTPSATPAGEGAFSGLKTSSTGFGSLQPGFGAFSGGSTTPSSSSFFQKPGATSTAPTSVFGSSTAGASATTPQSKDAPGAPKFGAPSFGASSLTSTGFFGKPPTSTTPSTPETPPNVATKSAFSAFGGSSSPFGATSGSSGKSFGDLLREGEEKSEDGKRDEGFSRTAEEWKRPVSVFAQLKEAAAETGKDGEDKDAEGEEEGAGDTSFRLLEDGSEGEDALDDFLKSDEEDLPSEEEDEGEEEELEEAEEAEEARETGGSERPAVPPTPAESPAQKASSIFGISFTPASPTKPEKDGEPSKPTFTRAASTTPPSSPAARERASALAINRAASAPPAGTPGLTPGLLGVGRPSTRPTRSSPLANRPISGDNGGEEEEEPPRSPLETKKARSASPVVPVPAAVPSRPKTPPALFGTATAPPKASPFILSSAASVAKPPISDGRKPSETGKVPLSGSATHGDGLSPVPISQGGLFGQQRLGSPFLSPVTPTAPPATAGVQRGMFSSPFTKSEPPALTPAASTAPPRPSPFALAAPVPTQSPQPLRWTQAGTTPTPRPESPAQSMLTEFTHLYNTLTRELDDLKALAAQASFRTTQLQKSSGSAKNADDLNEPTKWVMNDLTQFRHILKEAELGLVKWEKEKVMCILHLRELESEMLKGSTREEEVERFSKASKDTEFARMLKQRTLSPDHLETQAQLRRDIRAIRGRIQQLEEYIQASKKKLNSVKNVKPSIKPPSLDTINRTYRNIDAAIDQEEDDLANLTQRVAQLELSSQATPLLSFSTSTRDRRLPDRNSHRVGREVTPNIAASTAAALNAERSAQKLKKALLSARKQPLLNTKAVDAVPPEREDPARKALLQPDSGLNAGEAFAAGLNGDFPVFTSGSGLSTPQWSAPAGWSLPPFNIDSSPSPAASLGGRSRGQREKQHAKPIQLNQGSKPPLPPPPAGFSWGPVPIIQPILAGFGTDKGKAKEENGLGDSWVADDFGKQS